MNGGISDSYILLLKLQENDFKALFPKKQNI